MNKIHVIGIGFRPLDNKAKDVLLGSEVVLANKRLLDVFNDYAEYESVKERIIVHDSVYEMLDYIGDNYQDKKISLLAAGDPMFFGIGRLVIERFGQDAAEIYPDLSSVQVAFSRAKETMNDALLISLHGGPDPKKRMKRKYEIAELPYLLKRHDKIAILTDRDNGPDTIAKAIYGADVQMYVCEKIGYDDEKIIKGTSEEIAGMSFEYPNVVIIRSAIELQNETSGFMFGLREGELSHSRGLITKDEVRAVTIHKLRLPQEGVLWDVGAGSGSISIEAARLCPKLTVCAIEKNDDQISHISENRERSRIANINVVQGEAPQVLKGLPVPDRVFIGGSGGEIGSILDEVSNRMRSGIVVVNAVTFETLNDAVPLLEKNGFSVGISEVSVSRAKNIGKQRQMTALNPIFIISGERDQ